LPRVGAETIVTFAILDDDRRHESRSRREIIHAPGTFVPRRVLDSQNPCWLIWREGDIEAIEWIVKVARDAAGNQTTSAPVTITASNP
jgi:hypothetical protein